MTREPWDPELFAKCGCLAQLIDGPCNGEVVRFFPGNKVLEIPMNNPKPEFMEQELTKTSTPFKTVEYRLEFYETDRGKTLHVMGIWTESKGGSDWRRLLDDSREFRQLLKGGNIARLLAEYKERSRDQEERIKVLEALLAKPEPKHPKQTGQTIKAMFQVDGGLLSKALAGMEAEFIKKLDTEKKEDTPAQKKDTGDGTYSTSA